MILDVFSRNHGRLPIMARGARRPKSSLRGVLMNFQPLLLSWFGKGEVRTLHSAEWQGGQPYLQLTVASVQMNTGLDPAMFAKP